MGLIQAVILLQSCIYTTSMAIPILNARGTFYQVGNQTGWTFRQEIQQVYKENEILHRIFLPFVTHNESGKQLYEQYRAVTELVYPEYVQELQGMAHGSDIALHHMFVMQITNELLAYLDIDDVTNMTGCTDVLVNYGNNIVMGHNEDTGPGNKGKAFIVNVTITDEDHSSILEQFTSFVVPGSLPGHTFGFNNAGLIYTYNILYTVTLTRHIGVPRNFILRALLGQGTTWKRVLSIIEQEGYGTATGFSVNIGHTKQNRRKRYTLYNVEVDRWTEYRTIPRSKTSWFTIGQGNSDYFEDWRNTMCLMPNTGVAHCDTINYYHHVNYYQHLINISEIQDRVHYISSVYRTRRMSAMPRARDVNSVLKILGDSQHPRYPIYRTPTKHDNVITLATAIFDITNCLLHVYNVNPVVPASPVQTLTLPST